MFLFLCAMFGLGMVLLGCLIGGDCDGPLDWEIQKNFQENWVIQGNGLKFNGGRHSLGN
jgi:hypothetical protein